MTSIDLNHHLPGYFGVKSTSWVNYWYVVWFTFNIVLFPENTLIDLAYFMQSSWYGTDLR